MKEFATGFKYTLEGFRLIARPGIRWFVIIPFLVNTILFSLVIVYGAHQIIDLSEWLTSTWKWADWVIWLIWPLFVVISVTVVFFCFTLVANLLSAPFNGILAEAVEERLTGEKQAESGKLSELPREIIISIKNELKKLMYFLPRAVPLLLLFLIPMVNTIAPLIWLVFCSWLISLEYLDFPMSNHGILFSDTRIRLKSRRLLCIGFGLGTLLMTMFPVLNFVAMPVAVSGATKLWVNEFRGR